MTNQEGAPSPDPVSGCDPRVRGVVVCPQCHGDLEDRPGGLACVPCAKLFPVVDGVPWMLLERARDLPEG